MKSLKKSRTKLTLNKTTLRTLGAVELSEVAGGTGILISVGPLCVRLINSQQQPCDG